MSGAEELAEKLHLEWRNDALNYDTAIDSAIELRRLAQVEAEHEALKKAISDAVPVFWYRPVMNGEMYEGPHHNSSIGGKMIREEKPGEWVPLYTLEGIRTKP